MKYQSVNSILQVMQYSMDSSMGYVKLMMNRYITCDIRGALAELICITGMH